MCATRCWACVTAHRNPACEAWMCRPAHVSGSVAGLSPCHGLPLPTGWALQITICAVCARLPIPTRGNRALMRCCSRLASPHPVLTPPGRAHYPIKGCQPLGLIRRTRCVKELRARLDRLARCRFVCGMGCSLAKRQRTSSKTTEFIVSIYPSPSPRRKKTARRRLVGDVDGLLDSA